MAKRARHTSSVDDARALARAGRLAEAVAAYRRVIARQPRVLAASRELAQLLVNANQPAEAIECLKRACRVRDDAPAPWLDLAILYARTGHWDHAGHAAAEALKRGLDQYEPLVTLARHAIASSRSDIARAVLSEAHERAPDDPAITLQLGHTYLNSGDADLAQPFYEQLIRTGHDDAEVWISLGTAHRLGGRLPEARDAYDKALEREPDHPDAIAGVVQCLESTGQGDAAFEHASSAVQRGVSSNNLVIALARVARRANQQPHAIEIVSRELETENLQPRRRAALLFNLGMLYEDLGQYDDAFDAYASANAIQRTRFDRAQARAFTDASIEFWTPSRLATLSRARHDTSRAVFIVSMPRSGTSLVEQIMASHPDVSGGGELPFVPRLVRDLLVERADQRPEYPKVLAEITPDEIDAASRQYLDQLHAIDASSRFVTDKLPLNFRHLGYIAMLCPRARVIHCCRDPLDTCVSCFATALTAGHAYANDLEDLGAMYVEYQRLMTHWRNAIDLPMLDVSYEELVADPEAGARAIIAFLNLPWDPACLSFHESERVVSTASIDQVRKPIYTTSRRRHERFEHHLEPLRRQLESR